MPQTEKKSRKEKSKSEFVDFGYRKSFFEHFEKLTWMRGVRMPVRRRVRRLERILCGGRVFFHQTKFRLSKWHQTRQTENEQNERRREIVTTAFYKTIL